MSSLYRVFAISVAIPVAVLAACEASAETSDAAPLPVSENSQPSATEYSPWWKQTNDVALRRLIESGLSTSQEIACQISALHKRDQQASKEYRTLGSKLERLFGDKSSIPNAENREQRVERIATRRHRLIRQITTTYIEVRRLQEDTALRKAWREQYQDNREIAFFRREAGLTPAIDTSLALAQGEAAQGELGFAEGQLTRSMAELVRLSGETPESLSAIMAAAPTIPALPIDALRLATGDDPRRASLAETVLREARLTQALNEAKRTVKDARYAYRQGVGAFPALYVAEASVTAVELALISTKADRATTSFDVWSSQDLRWAREGLEAIDLQKRIPTTETITVTIACD